MPEQPPKYKLSPRLELLKRVAEIAERREETIIKAKNKEGKEISFNLEEIRQYWLEFYQRHNLPKLAENIKDKRIALSPEQISQIQKMAERGFDRMIILPCSEIQQANLTKIKKETAEKKIPGLPREEQYTSVILSESSVKPNFPKNIITKNRPSNHPYILFLKDTPEPDEETLKNQSPNELRQLFQENNQTGLTLSEYFIFQRDYTERNKRHPEHTKITWLLDSELSPQSSRPDWVLISFWYSDCRQVRVYSYASNDRYSSHGARSSAIFKF